MEIKGLTKIKGLGEAKARALYEAGYKSVEELREATVEELTEVEGIGPSLAQKIKEAVAESTTSPVEIGRSLEEERLLRVRRRQKAKKPQFRYHDSHKKKKLPTSWRRPRGLHNKLRRQVAAKGRIVKPGYGSPAAVRGLHPSGFEEILVYSPGQVTQVNPAHQAIRIAASVGLRKKLDIMEQAEERGIKVLNPVRRL